MGYLSLTVITSFTFLLAYSFLISGAHAKLTSSSEQTAPAPNELQKRPLWQMRAYPVRRLKPLGFYKKDFQTNDVEFDDVINDMEKRFDDYGHMR